MSLRKLVAKSQRYLSFSKRDESAGQKCGYRQSWKQPGELGTYFGGIVNYHWQRMSHRNQIILRQNVVDEYRQILTTCYGFFTIKRRNTVAGIAQVDKFLNSSRLYEST